MGKNTPIRAIIGVSYRPAQRDDLSETYYVKRAASMENYPGVWSLPSIQYDPSEIPDPLDLDAVWSVFARMSAERFGGTPITVHQHLVTGSSDMNPMGRMVELVLYRISFAKDPRLDPRFYTASEWLTRHEFELRTVFAPLPCGLCTKLWGQYQREHGGMII
jgi:hypothetical protein